MVIQKADANDLEIILTLQKKCYAENAARYQDDTITPMTQTLESIMEDFNKGPIYVAVEADHIIGSIRGYSVKDTVYIGRLFVDPIHQNKGVGKALMAHIEKSFPKCTVFQLFTGSVDEKNLSFYKNLGYKPIKEEAYNDKITLVYLEKETCGLTLPKRKKCCR